MDGIKDWYALRFFVFFLECTCGAELSRQCWVPPRFESVSSSAGQPHQLSGAWAEPPQLNWSHVLRGLALLLSLPWPLRGWAGGWMRRARVQAMWGDDLFTLLRPSGFPPRWHMAPRWQGRSTVVAPRGERALLSGEKTFLRRSWKRSWSTIAFIHSWQGFL